MSILYILIPLTLVVLAIAVGALIWAIRNRQFDDLDAQAWSVVLDDDSKPPGVSDEQQDQEPNEPGR